MNVCYTQVDHFASGQPAQLVFGAISVEILLNQILLLFSQRGPRAELKSRTYWQVLQMMHDRSGERQLQLSAYFRTTACIVGFAIDIRLVQVSSALRLGCGEVACNRCQLKSIRVFPWGFIELLERSIHYHVVIWLQNRNDGESIAQHWVYCAKYCPDWTLHRLIDCDHGNWHIPRSAWSRCGRRAMLICATSRSRSHEYQVITRHGRQYPKKANVMEHALTDGSWRTLLSFHYWRKHEEFWND